MYKPRHNRGEVLHLNAFLLVFRNATELVSEKSENKTCLMNEIHSRIAIHANTCHINQVLIYLHTLIVHGSYEKTIDKMILVGVTFKIYQQK